MATTYVGNSSATQSPGQQPLPGSVPICSMPADTDGSSWANFFQAVKEVADYIAYLQGVAKWRPPILTAGASGFTPVAHTGSGPALGAVPTPVSSTISQRSNAPASVLIKIILGGAIGTATFQWSNDGGNAFSGTTATTAGTGINVDPNGSGITVTFSGTLVANDTYAFQPIDCPVAAFFDSAGNIRSIIDHNGYPVGRRSEFREDWNRPNIPTTSASAAPITGTAWGLTLSGTGVVTTNQPIAGYPSSYLTLNTGTVNAATASFNGPGLFHAGATFLSAVVECEFAIDTTFVNTIWAIGLYTTGVLVPTTTTNMIEFRSTSGGNWFCQTNDGGSTSPQDSGFGPDTSRTFPTQRLRIEYHGSASPFGNCARFFINEKLVCVSTTHLPTGTLSFVIGVKNTAGLGAASNGFIGPVYSTWNRALSAASL